MHLNGLAVRMRAAGRATPFAVVMVALAAACGKQDESARAASCKPLVVTVDGVALSALPHGLAKANRMHGNVSYEVVVFDHDKATCKQLLAKDGRTIPDGEISVRAFAGGDGLTGKGVGIDAHTQMGGRVTLLGGKPQAVGDIVKVCVDRASFSPIAGAYKDKLVTVDGLFAGTYCGEASR